MVSTEYLFHNLSQMISLLVFNNNHVKIKKSDSATHHYEYLDPIITLE